MADNLTTFICRLCGSLNLLEPSGLVRGIALPYSSRWRNKNKWHILSDLKPEIGMSMFNKKPQISNLTKKNPVIHLTVAYLSIRSRCCKRDKKKLNILQGGVFVVHQNPHSQPPESLASAVTENIQKYTSHNYNRAAELG